MPKYHMSVTLNVYSYSYLPTFGTGEPMTIYEALAAAGCELGLTSSDRGMS